MAQQNDTKMSQWWLDDFVAENKHNTLKIFGCLVLVCLFMWYLVDYPELRLSRLIISVVVCSGMFWFYIIKSKKEK